MAYAPISRQLLTFEHYNMFDHGAPTMHTIKVILISGRSGSGKSSTSYEAAHVLSQNQVMHLTIEADNLDTMYPSQGDETTMLENLKSIWSGYWRRACTTWASGWVRKHPLHGAELVVLINGTGLVMHTDRVASVMQDVALNQEFAQKVEVIIEVFPIVLKADTAVVTERLTSREIGGELEQHLVSTEKMAVILAEWAARQNSPVSWVSNQGRQVHDVAVEVLRVAGLVFDE